MRPSPSDLAGVVRQRAPECGAVRVVAIDGRSGTGKSTLATALAAELDASLLRTDDVVPGWHGLDATVDLLHPVLAALADGWPGRVARWDWDHDRPGETIIVEPVPFLVVDGCGSGARRLRPFLSLLVWLDGDEPERRARALARDGAAFEPWWEVWAAQEERHYTREGTRAAADLRLPMPDG